MKQLYRASPGTEIRSASHRTENFTRKFLFSETTRNQTRHLVGSAFVSCESLSGTKFLFFYLNLGSLGRHNAMLFWFQTHLTFSQTALGFDFASSSGILPQFPRSEWRSPVTAAELINPGAGNVGDTFQHGRVILQQHIKTKSVKSPPMAC